MHLIFQITFFIRLQTSPIFFFVALYLHNLLGNYPENETKTKCVQ